MTRKYKTADFIMEELSLEELGLITGGIFGLENLLVGVKAAGGDDKPDNPWYP